MSNAAITKTNTLKEVFRLPVLVASLGYLVDVYDLFVFSIVRKSSLHSIGVPEDRLLPEGIYLLNLQMAGLLIGGIIWGIMGDKKGRLSVLFGSIIIYSIANIGNGLVHNLNQYAALRFIAGLGLAGELGAGITLMSEILPKNLRSYGATLVTTMGLSGAVLAYFVADLLEWRITYFTGGALGLLLLILRISVFESGMYLKVKEKKVKRGNFLMLFTSKTRLLKYLKSILIGVPIWFITGILITFSPEFGKEFNIAEPIVAGKAVMIFFSVHLVGNLVSGFFSHYVKSRKKVILVFLLASFIFVCIFLLIPPGTAYWFYFLCGILGFCNGYWTLFIAVAAELFGTNLRATVATTVPNFVRGAVIPVTALFKFFENYSDIVYSALIVGVIVYAAAIFALLFLEETFHKDLDYLEQG